jgi:2-C-methyl-D-erythritol 4-phosphate cytidylyltransferase
MNNRNKYVIIVAGGKGLRMGGNIPKQFMLLENRPVLMHTIQAFYNHETEIKIILVLPSEQTAYWKTLCIDYNFSVPHQIVSGGETRFHSVKNGLSLIKKELINNVNVLIGIHDGVRPLVDKELITRVYKQAESKGAAYPVIPVTDSMRKLTDNTCHVERSRDTFMPCEAETSPVDRSNYFLVQTPQVFKADILMEAYSREYKPEFTDDVSVVEASGIHHPVMVEGNRENIKITTPVDLVIAQALMKCKI